MTGVHGVPEGSSILIPRLFCGDPAAEVTFCVETFEAAVLTERPGPDGRLVHALLTIGPAMLMVEAEWPQMTNRAPSPDGSSPVAIFVYVGDVDAAAARAVARGARVLSPPANQFWGDRTAWILDPAGHVWTVATRIETTTAEQRSDRWTAVLKEKRNE